MVHVRVVLYVVHLVDRYPCCTKRVAIVDHFGELRSLCSGAANAKAFARILSVLDQGDQEQVKEQMLPYVQEHLASWPDALRTCPEASLEAFEKNDVVWGSLVRRVDYEDAGLNQKRLKRLMDAKHLGDVTDVNLGACRLKWDKLDEFAQNSPFAGLKSLQFRRNVKPTEKEMLAAFLSSPLCQGLEGLSLAGWTKIKPFVLEVLKSSLPLPQLKHLNFNGCKLSQKRLKPFLQGGDLDQLETLELRGMGLDVVDFTGSVGLIASHGGFKNLKTLRVDRVLEKEMALVAQAAHLGSLETVWFGVETDKIYEHTIEWLNSEHVGNLCDLNLSVHGGWSTPKDQQILEESKVLEALVNSQTLGRLEHLKIRTLPIPHHSIEKLANSPKLAKLKSLFICGDSALKTLLQSPHVHGLETLCFEFSVSGGALHVDEIRHLGESEHFKSLRRLVLNCPPDIEACAMLSQAKFLSGLHTLDLFHSLWSDVHVIEFLKHLDAPNLHHLYMDHAKLFPKHGGLALLMSNALTQLDELSFNCRPNTYIDGRDVVEGEHLLKNTTISYHDPYRYYDEVW